MAAALRLAAALLLLALAAAPASAAPGDADTTFGGDGHVTAAPGSASFLGALVLAGERIVGAGSSGDACRDVTLAAWRGDGALDATFGAGGIQLAPYQPDPEERHCTRAFALAVATGGRLLTAGGWDFGRGDGPLVTAHHADGEPDATFDGDGLVIDRSDRGANFAIVALPDGRVIAGGYAYNLGRTNWRVRRYLANGALDPSFDGDGEAGYPWVAGGPQEYLDALIADGTDGAFVAAGTASGGASAGDAVVIGRVRPDGSLDPAFGSDGRTRVAESADREARATGMVRTTDGGYVVAGTSFAPGSSRWLLYGFEADGDLDQTFGAAGRVDGPAGTANAIAVDAAGRLVVAGERSDGTFAVARYLVNGALDGTFGDGGIATVDFPGDTTGADDASVLNDVLVQPDGRIVVGGTLVAGGSTRMGVARLHGGDAQGATSDVVVVDDGGGADASGAQSAPVGRPPVQSGPVASLQSGGRVTITILSSRVTRRGVLVRVRWPQGTDGTARARLWTRNKGILLGQRTVRARPGTIGKRFRVPLNRRGRRLLQGGRRLKVVATVRVSGVP